MYNDSFNILLKFVYVFISIVSFTSSEYVPVLMWDSTQISPISPALEPVKQDVFQNLLIERIGKNVPVLVFAEENLSMEDFALYDTQGNSPFTKISSLQNKDEVGYLPFVKNPMSVVQDLPERNIIEMPVDSVLTNNLLSLSDNDVLIVNLNDAKEDEDRLEMLKRHDESVGKIFSVLLKKYKNLVTLFTGYHTSWVTSEELYKHRQTRDVQNDTAVPAPKADQDDSFGILYKNDRALLFVNGTPYLNSSSSPVRKFENYNFTEDVALNTNTMNLTFSSKANPEDIKLIFYVRFDSSYWYLNQIGVLNGSSSYDIKVPEVYAPINKSYHCNVTYFQSKFKDNNFVTLSLVGFQFQPFVNVTVKNITFGEAYDCVYFMTIPILSGLFVTIILVLIMSLGLTTIMEIKTMDRFDDPKGKTITISATE